MEPPPVAIADNTPQPAIMVEPLSPAVGLMIDGVDLLALTDQSTDMIQDLWQVGAALLFRRQQQPQEAARRLALALGTGAILADILPLTAIRDDWVMLGADQPLPPAVAVLAESGGQPSLLPGHCYPSLWLAGMEAAADALRMADPEFLAGLNLSRGMHAAAGPAQPLVHRHAMTGEACLYPPPVAHQAAKAEKVMQQHVIQQRFCYKHVWQPGDVLAFDPRAVRCKWDQLPAAEGSGFALPGTAPLEPVG
jgi:hypothetical protein